ncbi:MAG: phosphatidylglycerol lysyltransferase domain-containing protein [Paramuribaculum sp.]|nr:phosphatidylglycerol lysyltransferase domain-containing protein [Paramuribaculum sp.]
MRTADFRLSTQYRVTPKTLSFKAMTPDDIARTTPFLKLAGTRACDFTVGGMFMWADWFRYRMCVMNDTLFVKGLAENDLTKAAFSLPVGKMSLAESVKMLQDYCRRTSQPLILSAVPEERVEELRQLGATKIEELPAWADYIYDIDSLASFAGKKMNKKRNHINRFVAEHPDYSLEPVTEANIGEVKEFFDSLELAEGKSLMAEYDRLQVKEVLNQLSRYPFEGVALRVPGKGIVAFAFGEVTGDTLVVHIEKMDHSINGAGEIICRDFAAYMKAKYPQLRYENREDDAGDEGLRQAKQALNPTCLLKKYNVYFA